MLYIILFSIFLNFKAVKYFKNQRLEIMFRITKSFLFTMLSLVIMASCSDDKDPVVTEEIAKAYQGDEIAVTIENQIVKNGKATIKTKSDTQVELTLENIVIGHSNFVMDADVVDTRATCTLSGEKTVDGMIVKVTGNIDDNNKLNLTVAHEMSSKIVNHKWNYNTIEDKLDCLDFDIKTADGNIIMIAADGKKTTVTCEYFSKETLKTWSEMILGMAVNPFELVFQPNGFIDLKFTLSEMTTGTEAQVVEMKSICSYYYSDETKILTFYPNIVLGEAAMTMAIPFTCDVVGNKLSATLGYDFLKPLLKLIPAGGENEATWDEMLAPVTEMLPPGLGFMAAPIKGLIKDVLRAMTREDLESVSITGKLQHN